jgi:flagella basal body P-ring formation protein FlgA
MADISYLEGINSDEVESLCRVGVGTVEDFMSRIQPNFNYGIMNMSLKSGLKPARLIQIVPAECLPADVLPNIWLEDVTARVLEEAPPDDPWLKRCRLGAQRVARGFRGVWLGWRENLPIVGLVFGLLLILILTVRAVGGMRWLPWPLGFRDRALIVANDMPSGRVIKSEDFYQALLPFQKDHFRPDDGLQGLVLARTVSRGMPLRFQDTLRQQVIAVTDIQANTTIEKEDVSVAWRAYEPGAALDVNEVFGRKTTHSIRKDELVLSEFIK